MSKKSKSEPIMQDPIYVVDGVRTPFLKVQGRPGPFTASDLAHLASRELLLRYPVLREAIQEVIMGSLLPREYETNIARVVALRLGLPRHVPAFTVQRNCGSGMQALDCAIKDIRSGRHDLILAGGTEAMSHAPVLMQTQFVNWMANFRRAGWLKKISLLPQINFKDWMPQYALKGGLADPVVGMSMGQTAEELAFRFAITRECMDEFAFNSHQRLARAIDEKLLTEKMVIYDASGRCYDGDTGLRRDTSLEKLAQLPPTFEPPFGMVTAGNSSQVSDGAAMLLLASHAAVQRYQLPILGRIVDVQWAGLDPQVMGLGPVMAATPLLQRQNLRCEDIDFWEINEAFAGQVLACLKAWEDKTFCESQLQLSDSFGVINREQLNIDGGAIAIGHPVGASGARIVLHLLQVLKRKQAKRGLAALCIGGGQGGAMLLEAGI